MARRWARIWCVRPVSRRTRSSVSRGSVFLDDEVRHRRARLVGVGGDARADAPVAAERRVDRAAPRRGPAVDQGEVLALELAPGELRLERRVRGLRPRDDEQAGGVAVEPVHDPGPLGILAARGAPLQRLHERALAVPARRVHDDARRLVHDDQVLVLPGDPELRGGHGRLGPGRRVGHRHGLPAAEHVALGAAHPVDGDAPGLDHPLRRRARPGVGGEEDVEPLARRLGRDGQLSRHPRARARRGRPRGGAAALRGRTGGPPRRT